MRFTALPMLVPDPEKFRAAPPTEAEVWQRPAPPLTALLDLDAVDRLLADGNLRAAMLSVVRDGARQPAGTYTFGARPMQPGFADVVRPGRLAAELDRGATLVLESLHRTWPPLAALCRRLSFETGVPVQANAYLTPAGAQGFAHHYDTHSVLIVQTAGSKTWQLHAPVFADPLEHQPYRADRLGAADRQRLTAGEPDLQTVLRPGDVLWVPRGWVHNGYATTEPSLHVSFSLAPLTPYWLAGELVRALDTDPRFRRELPWGFGRDPEVRRAAVDQTVDQLRQALDGLDRSAVADTVADRYRRYFAEPRRAPVAAVLDGPPAPDTPVVAVPEAVCGVDRLPDGRTRLHLGDTAVHLDAAAAPVVLGRLEADDDVPWTARDLVPSLPEPAAVDLVGGLLRAGLVRPVSRPG